ncbi:hypothetical protein ACRN9N_08625 [Shewanella baltica]|uniref:hypothetical protein n=1 Tax=Shewanella baltica TaxID=62322 RepID=UPI003D7B6CB9
MDNGLVTFFDVTNCGFYRIRQAAANIQKQEELIKGSLANTLTLVTQWLNGREFSQTIPWDVDSNPFKSKVYCKDYYSDPITGQFLFVFCKALTNDSGALNGFIEDAKVGTSDTDVVRVNNKSKGRKLIYGQPMYYWFIPELNLIASINFKHSIASTENVTDYFKKCIDNYIQTQNRKVATRTIYNSKTNRDINIKSVSYMSDCNKFSMTYKFDAQLKELSVDDVSLEKLARNITHLVVRDKISSSKAVQDSLLFELFDKIRGKQSKLKRDKHVEIISEVNLDESELRAILGVYKEEQDDSSDWNNVGFRINNEDSTKWFNSYVDRKHLQIEPRLKKDDSYYPAKVLFEAIKIQQEGLLDFTKQSQLVAEEIKKAVGYES